MFNIEEILKMSKEMGIDISNDTSGKHYILDDSGKEIEFNTEMLIGKKEESNSYKLGLEGFNAKFNISSSLYKLSSCNDPYEPISVSVKESIINAA